MIKGAMTVAGVVLIGGGLFYATNDDFKTECAVHKLAGHDMGLLKNAICEVNFTVDA